MNKASSPSGIIVTILLLQSALLLLPLHGLGAPVVPKLGLSQGVQLHLATFNIYGPLYAADVEERTQRFSKALATSPVDLWALQELWRDSHHQWLDAGLRETAGGWYRLDFDRGEGKMRGLNMLSRSPLVHLETWDYTENSDGVADWVRGFLGVTKAAGFAAWQHPQFGPLLLVNTHLHHSSQAIRLAQTIELARQLNRHKDSFNHTFILGDFNFEPGSLEHRLLLLLTQHQDATAALQAGGACTYCSSNPYSWRRDDVFIDYIFYASSSTQPALGVRQAQLRFKERPLSDHLGVEVIFGYDSSQPMERLQNQETDFINQVTDIISNKKLTNHLEILNCLRRDPHSQRC